MYGCDTCGLDISRHDPHTCNLTLMGDGVYTHTHTPQERVSSYYLSRSCSTHTSAAVNSVSLKFAPLSSTTPSTYTCVARQRELMCVFLSMRKMWMRSECSGKWRGLCLERDVAHLIWPHKRSALSCLPVWTHRGQTHTHYKLPLP